MAPEQEKDERKGHLGSARDIRAAMVLSIDQKQLTHPRDMVSHLCGTAFGELCRTKCAPARGIEVFPSQEHTRHCDTSVAGLPTRVRRVRNVRMLLPKVRCMPPGMRRFGYSELCTAFEPTTRRLVAIVWVGVLG